MFILISGFNIWFEGSVNKANCGLVAEVFGHPVVYVVTHRMKHFSIPVSMRYALSSLFLVVVTLGCLVNASAHPYLVSTL